MFNSMPSESSGPGPLQRSTELLDLHSVEYLVIGGRAEVLMGSGRVTHDVDVCYRRTPDNLTRLAAALKQLGVTLRGAPPGLPFTPDARTLAAGCNFTFDSPIGPIDFLGEVEPLGGYDALLPNAEEYEIWGRRLRTIGLDDLIRVKRHIARPKDSESLAQLLAIKQIRGE